MAAPAGGGAGGAALPIPPDPLIAVRAVLDVCRFGQGIRDRFIATHRIATLSDFDFMSFESAKDAVKVYNKNQTRGNLRMGFLEQMRFRAFLWWYHEKGKMQETPVAAEFTDQAMREAMRSIDATTELNKANKVDLKCPKLDTKVGWFD